MTYASLRGLPSRILFNAVYAAMQAVIYAIAAYVAAKITGSLLLRAMLRALIRASRTLWFLVSAAADAVWRPIAERIARTMEIARAARDAALIDTVASGMVLA